MNTIKIALLGVGTVGGGVYKLLERRKKELPELVGAGIEIKKILVHNINKEREGIPKALLTDSFEEILKDEEIQIVVEVMGGLEPAGNYLLKALESGKNVVTANKDLIAEGGGELLKAAAGNKKDFLFEAAVAGGIPIIRPLKQCLAGNEISDITGIVNGTTNYILTQMTEKGQNFTEALKKAQELGFAEADPTADIEGLDAGRKVAIMASIAFHSRVVFSDVHVEGITQISERDIKYAEDFDCVIKLLGVACSTEEGIEVRVHPMLLPKDHPLASVKGAYNAVYVRGDAVDDVMFYGKGAGEFPTASAVVGDILDAARNIVWGCSGRISCTCYKNRPIKKMDDVVSRFYIRMEVANKPGELAKIARVFGEHQVSIARVVQKGLNNGDAELAIITDRTKEGSFREAVEVLKHMEPVKKLADGIRVYTEN